MDTPADVELEPGLREFKHRFRVRDCFAGAARRGEANSVPDFQIASSVLVGGDIWIRGCEFERHECTMFLCPHPTLNITTCPNARPTKEISFTVMAPSGHWQYHMEAFVSADLLANESSFNKIGWPRYSWHDPMLITWIAESNRVRFHVRCVRNTLMIYCRLLASRCE